MYVRDLKGEDYFIQTTMTNEYEVSGNQNLSFTLQPNKVNNPIIKKIDKLWSVFDPDDVEHKILYFKRKGQGERQVVDIKAVPVFFDEFDNDRIYEEYNEHMTATRCFNLIFENTNFNVVLIDNFNAIQWEGFGKGNTRLELFKRAIDRYNAEFRIQGNTVYLEKQIGRDTSIMYRHRLNASDIAVETDASEFWTYAKGYGDYEDDEEDGGYQNAKLIREYTSPLAQIPGIGIRHAPPIMDGRITDASTMDAALKKLVDESLKISITATIHDLREQGYDIARPEIGDRVFVIDERIGFNEEVRVVNLKLVRDWKGNVIDADLTFGSPSIGKRYQSNLETARRAITDVLSGKRELPYSVLDRAVRVATEALQRAQTELVFENGIIARDKNDPNRLVLFNSEGIGISDDGGNTFREAVTADGFVLTAGAIGRLAANHIQIGPETEFDPGYDPSEVASELDDFEDYVNEAFHDGIIEETEAIAIEKYLNSLEAERESITTRVNNAIENPYIDVINSETSLSVVFSFVEYLEAYDSLVDAINDAVADGKVTAEEKQNVETKFADYRNAFATLVEQLEIATNAIAEGMTQVSNEGLREDLRLAAPLPTSIVMNNDGITAYTSNPNRYARLDYRGLYIRGGAIQIDGGLPDEQIENAEKWNVQGTYIDENGLYTGQVSANQIRGGTLESTNGNFVFNMNGSRMDFYSSTRIRFYTGSNQLYRTNDGNAASISFPTSGGTDIPMMVVGTDRSSSTVDANSPYFVGLRVHNDSAPHSPNFVVGRNNLFRFLSRPDHSSGGFEIRTGYDGTVSRAIYPMDNPNNWTYNLGRPGTQWRWSNIYLKNNPDVSSDERLKYDIKDNKLGLDFIKSIETKTFRSFDKNNPMQFGIIAQQVRSVLKQYGVDVNDINMITESEDGLYGAQYEQLIAPIIRAIQELSHRVEVLENGQTT